PSVCISAIAAFAIGASSPLALAAVATLAWTATTAVAWRIARTRPVRVVGERALEQFVLRATRGDGKKLAERLVELWKSTLAVGVRTIWHCERGELAEIGGKGEWKLPEEVVAWLAGYGEPFAASEIGTMPLRALR